MKGRGCGRRKRIREKKNGRVGGEGGEEKERLL